MNTRARLLQLIFISWIALLVIAACEITIADDMPATEPPDTVSEFVVETVEVDKTWDAMVVAETLSVRSGCSETFPEVGYLVEGDEVIILSRNIAGTPGCGAWVVIQAGPLVGCSCEEYLK